MTTVEIHTEAPAARPAQGAGRRGWGPSVLVAVIVGWVPATTRSLVIAAYESGLVA